MYGLMKVEWEYAALPTWNSVASTESFPQVPLTALSVCYNGGLTSQPTAAPTTTAKKSAAPDRLVRVGWKIGCGYVIFGVLVLTLV